MKPDLSIIPEREQVELDKRRLFTARQKRDIFLKFRQKCALCGVKIHGEWTAGHIIPHSQGGKTEVRNGQPECPKCSPITHKEDTTTAARCKRLALKTGQYKRRKNRGGSAIKSRGFDKSLTKKFNGKTVKRGEE